jgi:glycosidase
MIGRIGQIGLMLSLALWTARAAEVPLSQRQARPSPEWLTGGVIYQMYLRAFTPEGTLKAAQARLPKVAELGATVIYLCPVFVADDDMDLAYWSPRQKKSGLNNPRNPYRMKDFYHVDPEYGTDQDLKDFVAAAHALKLRVLLDMVYLHCGPKAVFLAEHPDFVQREKDGKIVLKAWNFPGLNFACPALRDYLWQNMELWVRDYAADGFRCDVADGVPLDFWEAGRERLETIRPDVGMLAEGTKKENQLKAFDLSYGWGDAYKEWDSAAAIRKLWEAQRAERPKGGAKFARFIDNHDIANDDTDNRVEKRWGAARVEAAFAALFTLDGVPFVYNGQEVADTAKHSIYGRLPVSWASGETDAGKARFALMQKLCALRAGEKALTQGELTWLDNDQPEAVLSFARTLGGERIVAVINLTGQPVRVKVAEDGVYKPLIRARAAGGCPDAIAFLPHGYWVGKR